MSATDSYRRITSSPVSAVIRYYTDVLLSEPGRTLGEFVKSIQTGKTPPKTETKYYQSKDIDWIKPSDIGYGKYITEGKDKIANVAVADGKATVYDPNTLLFIGIGGGVGRVAILKNGGSSNQQITGITFNEDIDPEYAYYYFLCRELYIKSKAKSASFPIINQKKLKLLEFKAPLKSEQSELVKYLDYCWYCFENDTIPEETEFDINPQIFSFTKKLFLISKKGVNLSEEISHQQTLLTQLKQAILQEAIQGKLTAEWRSQHPEVEPASELLARIREEKERLIQEKKIKKQKPLPPVTEEEKPFELPEGWEWCRLGEVVYELKYGTSQKCDLNHNRNSPVLRIPNVSLGYVTLDEVKYTDLENKDKNLLSLHENDILMIRSNGSRELVGLAVLVPKRCIGFCFAGYLIRLRFNKALFFPPYIQKALSSGFVREQIETPLRTTVGINNINTSEISNLIIPIPPISEQVQISTKGDLLEERLNLLKKQIEYSHKDVEKLMQAVLQEAFTSNKV